MEGLLGLIGLGLLWVGALCLWAWSWGRHVQRILAAGFDVAGEHRNRQPGELVRLAVRRHTIGWSVFFFTFFALQGLAGFPVWQRLGLACALSVTYAGISMTRDTGEDGGPVPLFTPWVDKVWYFSILSAEWLGYFGVLVFLGQLFVAAA